MNKAAGQKPFQTSPELFTCLQFALKVAEQSGGAFDPTIRPLADLWGFIKKEGYRLPTAAERAAVLPQIGWRNVALDPSQHLVRFSTQGISLDPGGFGKGYAVDRALSRLKNLDIKMALVKAGGDLRVLGLPPGKDHWTIHIEDPKKKDQRLAVHLHGGALSTSGNYENFFTANGQRYSHLLDPRTGLPIQGIASCTVTAPTCLQTDTLATACFVLGVKDSFKRFGDQYGIHFVTEKDGQLKTVTSEKFP